MKVIYLPGKSVINKPEGEAVTSFLKRNGLDVYFIEWRHWSHPGEGLYFDGEMKRIISILDSFKDDLILIGKSTGISFILKLIKKYKPRIKQLILLGIPINDIYSINDRKTYPKILKDLEIPITVFQNKRDPHGTTEQIKTLLFGVKYELIKKDRYDDKYEFPQDILQVIKTNL